MDSAAPSLATSESWREKGLLRLRIGFMGYSLYAGLLAVSAWLGLSAPAPTIGILVFANLSWVLFYILIKNGKMWSKSDPMWAFPQVLASYLAIVLSFVYVPWIRLVAPAWLYLVILFDIRRLKPYQVWVLTILSCTCPLVSVALEWYLHPDTVRWHDELVFTLLGTVTIPSLIGVTSLARQIRKRQEWQRQQMTQVLAKLKRLSSIDGLTQLYNRSAMQNALQREAKRSDRSGQPFALALLDLDHFKQVNDRFGHAVGDQVLIRFGDIAKQISKNRPDVLARWGGEEFLFCFPQCTEQEAQDQMQRLLEAIAAYPWQDVHSGLAVSFSAGLVMHQPHSPLSHTIKAADQLLYKAKHHGRNQVVTAHTSLHPSVRQRPVVTQLKPTSAMTAKPARMHSEFDLLHEEPEAPRPCSSGAWARLQSLILGKDETMHPWVRMAVMACGIYTALIVAIFLYGIPSGMIPANRAWPLVLADALGATVPYVLVRSGIAKRWRDPSLSFLQICWACGITGLAMTVLPQPQARAYNVQLFCVALTFGMAHLTSRRVYAVGALATVMFMGIYGAMLWEANSTTARQELILQLIMTEGIVVFMCAQMLHVSEARERLRLDKNKLQVATEELRHAVRTDGLTQLFNRHAMQSMIEQEIVRHKQGGAGFSLALIDLDHFKAINDQLGHDVGDQVLQAFSGLAKATLRESDSLGRWGGEEFVLLVSHQAQGDDGFVVVERLRQHILTQPLGVPASHPGVSFSAGVAKHSLHETAEQLLARADEALYAAKRQGRNQSVMAA